MTYTNNEKKPYTIVKSIPTHLSLGSQSKMNASVFGYSPWNHA